METEIRIDHIAMEAHADAIEEATRALAGQPLSAMDASSTVTASRRGQEAYAKSQELATLFSEALLRQAEALRVVSQEFEANDSDLAQQMTT